MFSHLKTGEATQTRDSFYVWKAALSSSSTVAAILVIALADPAGTECGVWPHRELNATFDEVFCGNATCSPSTPPTWAPTKAPSPLPTTPPPHPERGFEDADVIGTDRGPTPAPTIDVGNWITVYDDNSPPCFGPSCVGILLLGLGATVWYIYMHLTTRVSAFALVRTAAAVGMRRAIVHSLFGASTSPGCLR